MSSFKSTVQTPASLRASCDRCHRAKVKCIFEQDESCIRCQTWKKTCHRSAISKLGRKPTGSRAGNTSLSRSCEVEYREPKMQLDGPRGASMDREGTDFQGLTAERRRKGQILTPEIYDEWQLDTTGELELQRLLTNTPKSTRNLSPHIPQMADPWIFPSSHANSKYDIPTISECLPDTPQSSISTTHSPTSQCPCASRITTKLLELQQYSSENIRLDHVLSHGKTALFTINGFLTCQVPHDRSVALLLFTLLQNILHRYREAWWTGSSHRLAAASADTSMSDRQQQIQFGEYTVDEEDGRALEGQILLLELKKLLRLIEKLFGRVQKHDDGMCAEMYNFFEAFLVTEAQHTIQKISP